MPSQSIHSVQAKQILVDWCDQEGISIKQLSRMIHCEYQHVWNIMRGTYPVTLPTLAKLLIYLGETGPAVKMAEIIKAEGTHEDYDDLQP